MSGELVPDRAELRASHEDRDEVVERLRVAAGDGRLTAEELDERLGVALTARTYGELEALLTDLPATGPVPRAGLVKPPKDVSRISVDRGTTRRDGPWSVPQRLEIDATRSSVVLDFTRAVIALPALEIDASVHHGSLVLVVPPDVLVDVDDVEVRAGRVANRARAAAGTPVRLSIHVTGEVHSGSLAVRSSRHGRRSRFRLLRRLLGRTGGAPELPY